MIASRPLTITALREVGFVPQVQSVRDKKPARPPVLTAVTTSTPQHPVFGKQPHSETDLRRQSPVILSFYYWKADRLIDEAEDTPERELLIEARGEAYEAILSAKPNDASDVARQLEVIATEMSREETTTVIGFAEFMRIAENLTDVTKPVMPAKMPGKWTRGHRLTKVGLLHRYCSFLLEELNTISYALYGERDYLTLMHFYDDAVRGKLRDRRRRHPFFDPSRMTERATRVLKSLKIDTVSVSQRSRKGTR